MEGLLKTLFGESFNLGKEGIMGMLGKEGFGNLFKGVTSFMNANNAGDMLDFQKGLAKNAQAKTDTLFQQDQEDKKKLQNLDFG